MKKRVLWSILLAAMLMTVAAPLALAYGSVTGQVNDGHGNPWTHGGTVSCASPAGNPLGSSTLSASGAWSVTLSARGAAICTVDPAAGAGGDPASFTCNVPPGGGAGAYACGAHALNAGPNAVSLASFRGQPARPVWFAAPPAVALALLALRRVR